MTTQRLTGKLSRRSCQINRKQHLLLVYKVNSRHSTDKHTIANAFNNYFTSIVSHLLSSVGLNKAARNKESPQESRHSTFKFQPVTEQYTLNQLCGLKTGKAAGIDNIPIRFLTDGAIAIATPLTMIINRSLSQSTVPTEWKTAKVKPLFKKGSSDNMNNYRPINVLHVPTVSKLLERAVHTQLCRHLHEHKILSPYQFGFRKGHSTELAAIALTDPIRRNIDQGQLTDAVFIDLTKAF